MFKFRLLCQRKLSFYFEKKFKHASRAKNSSNREGENSISSKNFMGQIYIKKYRQNFFETNGVYYITINFIISIQTLLHYHRSIFFSNT